MVKIQIHEWKILQKVWGTCMILETLSEKDLSKNQTVGFLKKIIL